MTLASDSPMAASPHRWLIYLTVFISGMTTLAIEFSASRLLQTTFGASNLIWANVVGLMLIYLTVGYFIGGRLADRWPTAVVMYRLVTLGAFLAGLVPLVAQPVIRLASQAVIGFQAGAALASFAIVLVLFALPVILLGCVSPFAIRLAVQNVHDAGRISGTIYAISTLGSILGTFLPVLVLWDSIGLAATFLLFALTLNLLGLYGLGRHNRRAMLQLIWTPVVLIILAVLILRGPIRPAAAGTRLLYEKESSYNFIQVLETTEDGLFPAGTRLLKLNEGQGIHSVWHPQQIIFNGTWDMFLVAPFFNAQYDPQSIQSVCIIGLAAGTISTQYTAIFGERVAIDGIEIDPAIIQVGRDYFGMVQPNLHAIAEDGRLGLVQSTKRYDVIGIDAYRVPYVPWHLTTVEFFREVQQHLTDKGVVVINVGRSVNYGTGQQDRRLVEAMTNTLRQVFPTVHTIDIEGSFNTILVATLQPTDRINLILNYQRLAASLDPRLKEIISKAIINLQPTIASDMVFTDDRAPVETIINAMLMDFLTGGGTQQFQR